MMDFTALAIKLAPLLCSTLGTGRREAVRHGAPVLASVTVPFSQMQMLSLFTTTRHTERVFWQQPQHEFTLVALGTATEIRSEGRLRFQQTSAAWHNLIAQACITTDPTCPVAPPLSVGGFAFDPSRSTDAIWQAYPAALLCVPRFLFLSLREGSWLTVNLLATQDCDTEATTQGLIEELRTLCSNKQKKDGGGNGVRTQSELVLDDSGQAEVWQGTVAAIVKDIRRGEVDKLVLARRVAVQCPQPIPPDAAIRRLGEAYPTCTIFAFARQDHCFVGATPERLVRVDGRHVAVAALAGSAPRGATEHEDRARAEALLADDKERQEHAFVVDALRTMLAPLCVSLTVPETPGVCRMANVQHLVTAIEGTLHDDANVLTLTERLHPTPACGGFPRLAALSLMRTHERFDRGWYAGPVGWLDGHGSGEFVVAIRSALLTAEQAWLYAGCGIVAGSDPQREYQESCLKLRPMFWALSGKE